MLKIKTIDENRYKQFYSLNKNATFYHDIAWYNLKKNEGKKCELLGLFNGEKLIGSAMIIYVRILRKYYYAYASRGFLYSYDDINSFSLAIKDYFKQDKSVIFFRMDPPIVLNEYIKGFERVCHDDSKKLILDLKKNGFVHYGYNMGFEANQFRFIHRVNVEKNIALQQEKMSKSTRKNILYAEKMGVKVKRVDIKSIDEVYELFDKTVKRKHIEGIKKDHYINIYNCFKDNCILYLAYIDKKVLLTSIDEEEYLIQKDLLTIRNQLKNNKTSSKLLKKEEQLISKSHSMEKIKGIAESLSDITNIAAMLCIANNNEIVSYVSGMDNNYRDFCPKYAMYLEMIKYAMKHKINYVNFLGVKNIFNKNDKDYGILEIKRGFGGETVEYIGEFDYPINKALYRIYKIKENYERKNRR